MRCTFQKSCYKFVNVPHTRPDSEPPASMKRHMPDMLLFVWLAFDLDFVANHGCAAEHDFTVIQPDSDKPAKPEFKTLLTKRVPSYKARQCRTEPLIHDQTILFQARTAKAKTPCLCASLRSLRC